MKENKLERLYLTCFVKVGLIFDSKAMRRSASLGQAPVFHELDEQTLWLILALSPAKKVLLHTHHDKISCKVSYLTTRVCILKFLQA